MFTSNWRCIIAAIGLTAIISLGHAQGQTDTPERESDSSANSPTTQMLPVPIQIIENDEESVARESREAEARQREIDDLIAQQGMNEATNAMNEATQRMVLYSLISTLLLALGTVAIFWTLRLARQANQFAWKAIKVTEKIGETSTRAWLSMDKFELANNTQDGQVFHGFTFVLPWQNVGQSPALDTHLAMQCSVNGDIDLSVSVESMKWDENKLSIHPRSLGPSALVSVSAEDIAASSKNPILIRVAAKYKIVSSNEYKFSENGFKLQYIGMANVQQLKQRGCGLENFHITSLINEPTLT